MGLIVYKHPWMALGTCISMQYHGNAWFANLNVQCWKANCKYTFMYQKYIMYNKMLTCPITLMSWYEQFLMGDFELKHYLTTKNSQRMAALPVYEIKRINRHMPVELELGHSELDWNCEFFQNFHRKSKFWSKNFYKLNLAG